MRATGRHTGGLAAWREDPGDAVKMEKIESLALLNAVLSGEKIHPDKIEEFLRAKYKEDSYLDYKSGGLNFEDAEAKQELRRDITAFANSNGGLLIIGVNRKHEVDGITAPGGTSPSAWAANVLHNIAGHFHPSLKLHEVEHAKGKILIIAAHRNVTLIPLVEKGRAGPVFYLRSGDTKFAAPDYLMADLFLGRRQSPIINVSLRDKRPVWIQQNWANRPPDRILEQGPFYTFGSFHSFITVANVGLSWIDEQRCGIIGYSFGPRAGIIGTHSSIFLPVSDGIRQAIDIEPPGGLLGPTGAEIPPELFHVDITGESRQATSLHPFSSLTYKTQGFIFPQLMEWWMDAAIYFVSRNGPPEWYQIHYEYQKIGNEFIELADLSRTHERPKVSFRLGSEK
jgi:hypothetical protein